MITAANYNFPLGIPGGYFNGKPVPPFPVYSSSYHVHFMRYLYYLCILGGQGEYPLQMRIEEIERAFEECKKKNCKDCHGRIKKILIGEAPPPNPLNYFYNPNSPWTAAGRPGLGGTAFTGAIQTALFPGVVFPTKLDFLIACAQNGFLLLDLFPYAISYTARGSASYAQACISAWGTGSAPYPYNLISTLDYLICCIQKTIAIGFALTSFGRIILTDAGAVAGFTTWSLANGITLNPPGPLDQIRAVPAPVPNASNYLRICHRRPLRGPCPILLNSAGF